MDNKITKARVGIHLEYDWPKYVAAVAAVIFLWALLFSMGKNVYARQKMTFFSLVYTKDAENTEFISLLYDELALYEYNEVKKKQISFDTRAATTDTYTQSQILMTAVVVPDMDFFIADTSYFELPKEGDPMYNCEESGGGRFSSLLCDFEQWRGPDYNVYSTWGFETEEEFEEAKYTIKGDGGKEIFVGFKLNYAEGSQFEPDYKKLFYNSSGGALGEEEAFTRMSDDGKTVVETGQIVKTYIIAPCSKGGNAGVLNKASKNRDTALSDEAYYTLKFFIQNYGAKAAVDSQGLTQE